MGYDEWLSAPYYEEVDEQERYELAKDIFLDSDYFLEALDEWLEVNPNKTQEDFKQSPDFESWVLSSMDKD